MTSRRPPFLAVIEPEAAEVILREVGEQLEKYARQACAFVGTPAERRGRSVLRALAMLEESTRQWREARSAEPAAGAEDVVWLSTAQVARELRVTVRQVLNYIDGGAGPLPASRAGRPWRVRAGDLEDFRCGRSEVAG